MTRTELVNLGIETAALNTSLKTLNDNIKTVAATYPTKKIEAGNAIRPLRQKIRTVHSQAESPVDYVKTEIKSLPLAADSLSMDLQFFSVDSNDEQGEAHAKAIAGFASSSNSLLGTNHNITGTLVTSVSCTHKKAAILAPCIPNIDKGIRTWTHLFGKTDKFNPTSVKEMKEIALADDTEGKNKCSILSGMTFESSSVGMVHFVNTTQTKVVQSLKSMATSLQAQMQAGAWFEEMSGGFGVNSTFGNEVKSPLTTQNVTSHVTLITMGTVPSIVASNVAMGVKKFAGFDPKSSMESIASMQNATVAGQSSTGEAADAARTGQKMVSLKASDIKVSLSALGEIDDKENKVLDMKSLIIAIKGYLGKVPNADSRVPIAYYLKDITKGMLAEMSVAKYYPRKYNAIKNDDSEPVSPKPESEK